jgi:7,8-dihydropterin-6-yl-methyl-4-(beta-D-ribofuranosyl)aminobenzene 5'-phosphate synthase
MPTRITVLVDDRKALGGMKAEHGLALWVEHEGHKLLFDTGAPGHTLVANAAALSIRLEDAEAICLSHGHIDHTGGLAALAPRMGGVDIYAHPDVFVNKYAKASSGGWHPRGIAMSQGQLEAVGIFARLSKGPQEPFPGVLLTGEVEREARFVPSTPQLYADSAVGRIIDPFHDDQALVLRGRGGLIILSGCAHSGIVNLCRGAQRLTNPHRLIGQDHIRAVVGGFHLVGAAPQLIQASIEGLRALDPEAIHPCHCTGEPAHVALTQAFPSCTKQLAAGSVLEF